MTEAPLNRAWYPLVGGHVVYLDASFGQQLLTQQCLKGWREWRYSNAQSLAGARFQDEDDRERNENEVLSQVDQPAALPGEAERSDSIANVAVMTAQKKYRRGNMDRRAFLVTGTAALAACSSQGTTGTAQVPGTPLAGGHD